LTGTTPPGAAGAQDMVVFTATGSGTLAGGFTYVPPPTLSSTAPNSGPTAGGTSVTITGSDFTNVQSVTIGGHDLASLSEIDSTPITGVTPAAAAGAKDVVVTTQFDSATLAGAFTYILSPAISSIAPNSGPTAGGTSVTITGSDFTNVQSVTIGGLNLSGLS